MSAKSTPRPTIAAWWQTRVDARDARRAATSGSRTSPSTSSARRAARRARASCAVAQQRVERRAPRGRLPAAASTTCEPMNPAPPVTQDAHGAHRTVAVTIADPAVTGRMQSVIDVVLPVLDEAEALPWVLGRMPAGLPADRRRQRLDRRLRRASRRASGARVVVEPQRRASAPPASPGCTAAERRRRLLHGLRRLARPARPAARRRPRRRRRRADLVLGARRPPSRGAWPLHARLANRVLALRAAPPHRPRRCATSARCAPPAATALLDLGIARPPLRLAAGDGAARAPGRLADRRGRRPLPPARRALEGHRHRARHRAHGPRHGGGAAA